jgi:signal transduction histidine kinase
MADLLQQVVESAEPSIHEKHQRIRLKICDHIPVIRGDRGRLQQVVSNLLSNAIKFTPNEGHIKVELYQTSSDLHVAVEDNGNGISRKFLPHVFDEFRQADMSSVRKKGGLGLGLSIARRLVELHGGSIKATSAGAGRGAKFVLSLPLSVSEEKAKATHTSRAQ